MLASAKASCFRRFAKAQITLEALLIFLISLSLVVIALSSIILIDKNQQKVAYSGILNMQADQIEEFANQACILGEGNFYTLNSARINFYIEQSAQNSLVFKTSNSKTSRTFICQVEVLDQGPYNNKIFIWYENGKVFISNKK
jgi:hypothetical protein